MPFRMSGKYAAELFKQPSDVLQWWSLQMWSSYFWHSADTNRCNWPIS